MDYDPPFTWVSYLISNPSQSDDRNLRQILPTRMVYAFTFKRRSRWLGSPITQNSVHWRMERRQTQSVSIDDNFTIAKKVVEPSFSRYFMLCCSQHPRQLITSSCWPSSAAHRTPTQVPSATATVTTTMTTMFTPTASWVWGITNPLVHAQNKTRKRSLNIRNPTKSVNYKDY